MTRFVDHRHGGCNCPGCGRFVDLDLRGYFRRHFPVASDGRRRLCMASGRGADEVMQLLTVDPTPQERYSRAGL